MIAYGSSVRLAQCSGCGRGYRYVHTVEKCDVQRRRLADAERSVRGDLLRDAGAAPCPKCGDYTADMRVEAIAKATRKASETAYALVLAAVVALVLLGVRWALGHFGIEAPNVMYVKLLRQPPEVFAALALLPAAAAAIVWRFRARLGRRGDPMRAPLAKRLQKAAEVSFMEDEAGASEAKLEQAIRQVEEAAIAKARSGKRVDGVVLAAAALISFAIAASSGWRLRVDGFEARRVALSSGLLLLSIALGAWSLRHWLRRNPTVGDLREQLFRVGVGADSLDSKPWSRAVMQAEPSDSGAT